MDVKRNKNELLVNLEEETRLVETIAVYKERIQESDFTTLLFGKHLFDSAGNYDRGVHKDRPLHLDINIVLHGSGLIGLFLLLMFYATIFLQYLRLKIELGIPHEKLITGCFLGIYFSHLFLLLSGGMLSVTFNLISYLYMGAILGLYQRRRSEIGMEQYEMAN